MAIKYLPKCKNQRKVSFLNETLPYALWYTLKDYMFAIIFYSIRCIKNKLYKLKSNVNNVPVELISSKRKISVSFLQDINHVSNTEAPDEIANSDIPLERKFCHDHVKQGKFCNVEMLSSEEKSSTSTLKGNDFTFNSNSSPDENKTVDEKYIDDEYVDKGYFGIVTYYVQIAADIMIHIEFSDIDKSESFLEKIIKSIEWFLNMELSQLSFDVCPVLGLTTLGKHLYKLMFLIGIYLSWAGFFVITMTAVVLVNKANMITIIAEKLKSTRIKLIRGIVEIQ